MRLLNLTKLVHVVENCSHPQLQQLLGFIQNLMKITSLSSGDISKK